MPEGAVLKVVGVSIEARVTPEVHRHGGSHSHLLVGDPRHVDDLASTTLSGTVPRNLRLRPFFSKIIRLRDFPCATIVIPPLGDRCRPRMHSKPPRKQRIHQRGSRSVTPMARNEHI